MWTLWEDLAELLADKRMPAELDRHVAPLASAWAPWPALEVALARADFELLDPGSAAERLQRALEVEPYDLDLQVMRGWALLLAGRSAEAVGQLRAANELQPGRPDVQRVLAMAMVHAGMPEGLASIEGLVLDNPEDEELKAYLQPGPPPPLPLGWRPAPGGHAH